jgi:hypothetical protein
MPAHLRHRLEAILPFVNDILDLRQALLIDIRNPSDYSAVVVQQATDRAAQRSDPAHTRKAGEGYHAIIREKQGGIARLTFNRPESLKAVREPTRVEIGAAIREIRRGPSCTAVPN